MHKMLLPQYVSPSSCQPERLILPYSVPYKYTDHMRAARVEKVVTDSFKCPECVIEMYLWKVLGVLFVSRNVSLKPGV